MEEKHFYLKLKPYLSNKLFKYYNYVKKQSKGLKLTGTQIMWQFLLRPAKRMCSIGTHSGKIKILI